MSKKLNIKNIEINIKTSEKEDDFISLTDMAKWKNAESPDQVIANWMRTNFTISFLGLWEMDRNENFNPTEFEGFKNQTGENAFTMSPQKWIKSTNAVGIYSKSGRYGGGTFAHKDIAFEFASWLSPEFKLYLIKEFQRLKQIEKTTIHSLEWQVKRSLVKTNYKIHTDAIKKQLESLNLPKFEEKIRYADEADMLNLIMFGQTAKEWRDENEELAKQGLNIRDVAIIEHLIVLSGLETLNAYLLDKGVDKEERMHKLIFEAKKNFESIKNIKSVENIKILAKETN